MFLIAPIPVAWFNDDLSKKACVRFEIRLIKAKDWIALETLAGLILPIDFDLRQYLSKNMLHAIYFKTDTSNVLIHPDALLKLCKRTIKQRIKRERVSPRRLH